VTSPTISDVSGLRGGGYTHVRVWAGTKPHLLAWRLVPAHACTCQMSRSCFPERRAMLKRLLLLAVLRAELGREGAVDAKSAEGMAFELSNS
jgi:hypothetical protein